MNVIKYLEIKKLRSEGDFLKYRSTCENCWKDLRTCYCAQIRSISTGPFFKILIHPLELKNKLGTGRMSHLCINNSDLIRGVNFTENIKVNQIINNTEFFPVLLFPSENALDLSIDGSEKLNQLVPENKKLIIFIMDATWPCARKSIRISTNLTHLPKIKFSPSIKSAYLIRKQPRDNYLSTIEAIHWIQEKLSEVPRWKCLGNASNLIQCFQYMVRQQLSFVSKPNQVSIRGQRVNSRR